MRRYLILLLGLFLGPDAAHAGEGASTQPATQASSSYPSLTPEHRLQKIQEALDQSTEDEARVTALCDLARSGYCRQSAEALAVIVSSSKYSAYSRWNATEGLRGFAHAVPEEVREPIRQRLREAVKTEQEKLPNGPLRVLLLWGDADWVMETLGDKLRGRPEEVEVLSRLSSRELALARLWELYQCLPGENSLSEWIKRRHIGMTMTDLKDKRGIDILLECLLTKEFGQGLGSDSAAFRENIHGTFGLLAVALGQSFGYDIRGQWKPQLAEVIPEMVRWWKTNRYTWDFARPAAACSCPSGEINGEMRDSHQL